MTDRDPPAGGPDFAALATRCEHRPAGGGDDALAATLLAHAAALDDAFRRLLAEAPGRYEKLAHYSTALRAQNQFRHTLLALNALKNNKTAPEPGQNDR